MDWRKKPNGKFELRWREGTVRRSRTFDRKRDMTAFEADRVRRKQLGHAFVPADIPFRELTKTYWRLHVLPNLAAGTRDSYRQELDKHIIPRLGEYTIRELTAGRIKRFRDDLERAPVGTATVRLCMAIVQSILSFAVSEGLVEFNAAAGVRKPRYVRAREPHIFLPAAVELIRSNAVSLRDRTLVSVLAYSGPRPEELVCRLAWNDIGDRTIRYQDTKRHRVRFTPLLAPLADDLREWFLASGRPDGARPVFPAHDGELWNADDWANWRNSVWKSRPERKYNRSTRPGVATMKATVGIAPASTRPRDLRSSYVTLRVYEGIPLTTIAREVGTSILMIERHYAGVIEDWDGVRIPAEQQIRAARASAGGREMDVKRNGNEAGR